MDLDGAPRTQTSSGLKLIDYCYKTALGNQNLAGSPSYPFGLDFLSMSLQDTESRIHIPSCSIKRPSFQAQPSENVVVWMTTKNFRPCHPAVMDITGRTPPLRHSSYWSQNHCLSNHDCMTLSSFQEKKSAISQPLQPLPSCMTQSLHSDKTGAQLSDSCSSGLSLGTSIAATAEITFNVTLHQPDRIQFSLAPPGLGKRKRLRQETEKALYVPGFSCR